MDKWSMDKWSMRKVVAVIILSLGGSSSSDPCDPVFHRVLRRSFDRGVRCEVQNLANNAVCDRRLERGWYRASTDSSSLMMPTTCLKYVCGTVFPIWLNGTHPSPDDGIVDMTACQKIDTCCDNTYPIKVKNCNGFFVYYLYPTAGCPEGYCFGSGPCLNAGEDSTTSSAVSTTSRSTTVKGTSYTATKNVFSLNIESGLVINNNNSKTEYPNETTILVERQSLCGLQVVSFLVLGLSCIFAMTGFILFVLAIRKRKTSPVKTRPYYCEPEHVYEILEKPQKY